MQKYNYFLTYPNFQQHRSQKSNTLQKIIINTRDVSLLRKVSSRHLSASVFTYFFSLPRCYTANGRKKIRKPSDCKDICPYPLPCCVITTSRR